jgi:hypothetical protein
MSGTSVLPPILDLWVGEIVKSCRRMYQSADRRRDGVDLTGEQGF